MQLAANWPDKRPECQVSASDQCGNPTVKSRAIITKPTSKGVLQVQRLSEARFQFCWVNKTSDSPIPQVIADRATDVQCFWRRTSERFRKEIHR